MSAMPPAYLPTYLKDPAAIYRQSFAAVRAAADLSRFPPAEARVVERLIHACGMPDIQAELRLSEGAVAAGLRALREGRPVLCDGMMTAAGVIAPRLPVANPVLCLLPAPDVAQRAAAEGTTRSAAQVALWRPHMAGAVVAIGNAPTALFRLLEELAAGAPRPSLVLGFPVGFVGAAESKQALTMARPAIPHIALLGRRGGSALAAAAVNALAGLAAEGPP